MEFGRHARLPVDWIHEAGPFTEQHTLNGWVRSHHQVLSQVWRVVQQHTKRRQQEDKGRRDRRAKATELQVGERVLLRHFRRRAFGKLTPRWQRTPYVVVSQLRSGQHVYLIRPEGEEGPVRTAHRNNLRVCPFSFPQDASEGQAPSAIEQRQSLQGDEWDTPTYQPLVFWRSQLAPVSEEAGPGIQTQAEFPQLSTVPQTARPAKNSTEEAESGHPTLHGSIEVDDQSGEQTEAPGPRRSQ